MGTILTILFCILLVVGAICSIAGFLIAMSLSNLLVNLNERLAQLVEILFVLGEQKKAIDPSIERIPGRGQGLQDLKNNGTYDPRHATQAQPSPEMKWGENTPIAPDGNPANGTWDKNLQ